MADLEALFDGDDVQVTAYRRPTSTVMISFSWTRTDGGPPPADLLKSLGKYFDRPQQLIGQTAYDFTHLRFNGREPAVRDHVFQRS